MEVSKRFTFEASHILPRHPGKCSRLHGHSWQLEVAVKGEVNAHSGFVIDFSQIGYLVESEVISELDHKHLGTWTNLYQDIPVSWRVSFLPNDFYPSCENVLAAIGRRLLPVLEWSRLTLNETATTSCVLHREEVK